MASLVSCCSTCVTKLAVNLTDILKIVNCTFSYREGRLYFIIRRGMFLTTTESKQATSVQKIVKILNRRVFNHLSSESSIAANLRKELLTYISYLKEIETAHQNKEATKKLPVSKTGKRTLLFWNVQSFVSQSLLHHR